MADSENRSAGDGLDTDGSELGAVGSSVYDGVRWDPVREHLEILVGYGLTHNKAVKALYFTGNDCPELALAWAIENPDFADEEVPPELKRHLVREFPQSTGTRTTPGGSSRRSADRRDAACGNDESEGPYKMVFVVNMELGMGVGKLAAQVGHAAVGLFRELLHDKAFATCVRIWDDNGGKKICLKGQATDHLNRLVEHCQEVGLPFHLVEDAGLTQIPAGSLTVLAVFGPESQVNVVTGALPLL